MKRVLVDFKGSVQGIANVGEEFEIYEGPDAALRWVNCDNDNVNPSWILVNGTWYEDVSAPPSYEVLRRGAYGEIGDQLDMLYKDMKNGTTNWIDHIETIKSIVPGPNSAEAKAVLAARPPIPWCSQESPAWTDENNEHVEGVLHTVGLKDTVVETPPTE
jgi:hypothetical protein